MRQCEFIALGAATAALLHAGRAAGAIAGKWQRIFIKGPLCRIVRLSITALVGGGGLWAAAANATDGTWTGAGSNSWTAGANWNSTPANTVPDNTATFTNNGAPTSITVNGNISHQYHSSVTSGAHGVFQFTHNTALWLVRRADRGRRDFKQLAQDNFFSLFEQRHLAISDQRRYLQTEAPLETHFSQIILLSSSKKQVRPEKR